MMPLKIRVMPQEKVKNTHEKIKKIYLSVFLFLLLSGLLSCGNFAPSGFSLSPDNHLPVTKIGDLEHNRDLNSMVYLKGKVVSQSPFLGSAAYELQDTTGSIWVITNHTLPAKGDEVLIEGKVQYQSIPIGGKDLGEVYVQEQEQLERRAAQKQ
ncbi:MAG: hypothetical protein NVS2B14_03180 [Chamaesiphon sp.]